jgi:nucleoside-diphosphate-sugar epimerase
MGNHTDVVCGAGPLGLAVTRALLDAGRPVRVVSRSGRAAVPGAEQAAADLTDPTAAAKAFDGADVVYHCASVPRPSWTSHLAPLMDTIVRGAAEQGASLVYADNLYAYGPVTGPLTEDLPYAPQGPKERVRAELAETLMSAHRDGRVRAAIGRASDFFGPHVTVSNMGDRVFPAALAGRAAKLLPDVETPHTYTFIDDFARALTVLGANDTAYGQAWHVPSAPTVTTREFVELVYAEAGNKPKLSVLPKPAIAALSLVNATMRDVRECLYQSERPFIVDHSKYEQAFGAPTTPHTEAIRATLAWY